MTSFLKMVSSAAVLVMLLGSVMPTVGIRVTEELADANLETQEVALSAGGEVARQPSGWKGCCFDPMEQIVKKGQQPPGRGKFKNVSPAVCCVCKDGQVRVGANWKCNVCRSSKRGGGVECAHKLTELEKTAKAGVKGAKGNNLCTTGYWQTKGLLKTSTGKALKISQASTEPCNRLCEQHLKCSFGAKDCKKTCPKDVGGDNINKFNEDFEEQVSGELEHIAEDVDHIVKEEEQLHQDLSSGHDKLEDQVLIEDTMMVEHAEHEHSQTLEDFPDQVKHNSDMYDVLGSKLAGDESRKTALESGRDKVMSSTLEEQEEVQLEIDEAMSELEDLEQDSIKANENSQVKSQIKHMEDELLEVHDQEDTLVDDLEKSLQFLDETDALDMDTLNVKETINEDTDVLREEKDQMSNLKDVYSDVTSKTEKSQVASLFNGEKALTSEASKIIKLEEQLAGHEDLFNSGKKSVLSTIVKEENAISQLEQSLAVKQGDEIFEEDVLMHELEADHPNDSQLKHDLEEVIDEGEDLEHDLNSAIGDDEVLFTHDTASMHVTDGKLGGDSPDNALEQGFKTNDKFMESENHAQEFHSIEEIVEAEIKNPC